MVLPVLIKNRHLNKSFIIILLNNIIPCQEADLKFSYGIQIFPFGVDKKIFFRPFALDKTAQGGKTAVRLDFTDDPR